MLSYFRRHLGWKIFLSYLIVIIVGTAVLAAAAEIAIPSAFNRHMSSMGMMMGNSMGMDMNTDLFSNFRSAVLEALSLAALAAFLAAAVVSLFVSRQVVAPVRAMRDASQRIAEGHYDERVAVTGNIEANELDELSQLALSFNQMAANLEKTETMRRQLIGDVTHELRTPLTAIKGSMEGLIDDVLPAEDETFQQIYKEADRLQHLVDDLQELSRVEAGAFELTRSTVSIASLVEATIDRLGHQFEAKDVSLQVDIPENMPDLFVDEDRIGQVFLNIAGNALQYTPAGGSVKIHAKLEGDEVHFSISDTGIGISVEHLPHLFTRFYRVDKSRARASGGSGVGLTISSHLVNAHGGHIWATSPGSGKGSTFTFSLPLSPKNP
ncbi:MAG: HAMP domain-containing protein [Chloroflexi bacterium]|nr:MAG: HAMP domain-containing protein [Chloroflexota bacterium]